MIVQQISTKTVTMRRILQIWDVFLVLTLYSPVPTQFVLIVTTAVVVYFSPFMSN